MQLELFSPDRMALAEGWERAEALDFAGARAAFAEVLERWPDAEEAREALELLERVARLLGDLEPLGPGERVARLWAARRELPVRGAGARLRRAILGRALAELERAAAPDPACVPCAGEVLLELDRPREAERWLAGALARAGPSPRLLLLHGEALWALERRREARRQWLRALLLLGPEEGAAAAAKLPDAELGRVVAAVGVDRAPVEAWLGNLTWLLPAEELPPRSSPALEAHRLLAAAEAARGAGDLDAAVRCRMRLLELDPGTLSRYMERIGGG